MIDKENDPLVYRSTDEKVPLVDCSTDSVEYLDVVAGVMDSGRFIGGEEIDRFEKRWAETVEAEEAVAVSSGTDALGLMLRHLRLNVRDNAKKVVVPATSFVATRDAVHHAGLKPVFCDVNENGLMDPAALIRTLRQHHDVLAVIPVHLYGQVADIKTIENICDGFDVRHIVEDACQAHGAKYNDTGDPVGSRHPAAWSFMPAKILGTWGDGGAITLPCHLASRKGWFSKARNHGRNAHNKHEFPGFKMRMDALKAAILNKNLDDLDGEISQRKKIAYNYMTLLRHLPIRLQPFTPGRVWSYFAVWAENRDMRDSLFSYLKEQNIGVGKHYPYVLGSGTQAKTLSETTLSFPLWGGMSLAQVDRVINTVQEFFGDSFLV